MNRGQTLAALGGIQLAILLGAINATSVATALPEIADDLEGFDRLAWVVTAYLIATTASAPLYGKLSDVYGRRRLFLVAIGIVLVASVLAGLARSMPQLIACRALQGLGGGGLVPLGLAAVGDLFPPRVRGRYQGYVSATFAAAAVLGPLAGGVLTDHLSWRFVFLANVPVALIAMTAVQVTLRAPAARSLVERRARSLDVPGAVLLAAGVSLLQVVVVRAGRADDRWTAATLGLALVTVAVVAAFVVVERRAADPVVPLRLLRRRGLAVPVALGSLIGASLYLSLVYVPVFAQGVLATSATRAGTLLVPLELMWSTVSVAVGYLVYRTGRYRVFPTLGMVLLVCGLGLLATMGTGTGYGRLVGTMLLVGTGMGLSMSVLSLASQNAVPHAQIGTATGLYYFATQMGSLLAVGIGGSVLASRFAAEVRERLGSRAGEVDLDRLLRSPSDLAGLGPDLAPAVREGMGDALHWVFAGGMGVALVAVVTVAFLRELPLRRTNEPDPDEAAAGITR